jgi:exodeoxyribonuclease VII small subunit
MMQKSQPSTAEPQSFEAALARLEEIASLLNKSDVPLEESLALVEEAVTLREYCRVKLQEAEARLEKLMENADGSTRVEPLSE